MSVIGANVSDTAQVTDRRSYYVALSNTDPNGWGGRNIPVHVCELEATAKRLAEGIGPNGTDGRVKKIKAIKVDCEWLVPVHDVVSVHFATKADEAAQKRADAKASLITKLIAAGFTKDEIAILGVVA